MNANEDDEEKLEKEKDIWASPAKAEKKDGIGSINSTKHHISVVEHKNHGFFSKLGLS